MLDIPSKNPPRAPAAGAVNLLAGQIHFTTRPTVIKTLLGSCVAVVLWHPARRIGGMCHFLLPNRTRPPGSPPDARYGDEAMELLLAAVSRHGTAPREYETHLYGGADTMPDRTGIKFNIGERNIEQGCSLIDRYGFDLQAVDVGDYVPRTVTLDMINGHIDVRRGQPAGRKGL
jgi:chemotaxis protein CheD